MLLDHASSSKAHDAAELEDSSSGHTAAHNLFPILVLFGKSHQETPLSEERPYGKTMPYTPAYAQDPEKGVSSPTRLARRFVPRKPKLIISIFILGGVLFFLYESGTPALEAAPGVPHHHEGYERPVGGWEPGWDEEHDEEITQGAAGGWGNWLPFKDKSKGRPRPPVPTRPDDYDSEDDDEIPPGPPGDGDGYQFVIDDDGDHFITNWEQQIAPMHPDVSLLPEPSSLLPEVDITVSSPPGEDIYPPEELRNIISPIEDAEPEQARLPVAQDSYARLWKKPEEWDGPKTQLKKVQWDGFSGGRSRWESEEERKVREDRKEAVRRGFKHAWEAYKRDAWGHDEIRPVSMSPSDPFNGWGATIVDSLDTLLLMGFSDEYNLCRPHVNQLNFHWVGGRDWSRPYVSDDSQKSGVVYALARDRSVALAVFETGIRYLGGMLGAYDLSGDQLLVDRAEELAQILSKAFNTISGLPAGRVDPGLPEDETIHLASVSIAEVGSMSLEFIRLSQITKDRKWFDLAQRAMDYIDERVVPRSSQSPLIPTWFQPDASIESTQRGAFTFGGLADSYYEYLVKTYKLLGGSDVAQIWRRVYEGSIDKAKELLYKDITVVPGHDLLTIGKWDNNHLIHEMEHLTCFAGAMLGLGAKLLDRPGDMDDALRVTGTCYWLSADTPTGLQPEVAQWYQPEEVDDMYINITIDDDKPYHPRIKSVGKDERLPGTHKDVGGTLRWNGDGTAVRFIGEDDNGPKEPVRYARKLKGTPAGVKRVVGRGINRPETIESIFYMYRLTGDRKWQEKGWKMFVSWMETSKVDGGFSSVQDVTADKVRYGDNMESFALAETFKYHFLLQSEPDVLSLDDYVLNTEAHPFLVNPKLDPTSSAPQVRYWTPSSNEHLGVRGQGTNVQKFARLEVIDRARGPQRHGIPVPQNRPAGGKGSGATNDNGGGGGRPLGAGLGGGRGGGGGMGGGGGRPGDRPKPPPDFMEKVKEPQGQPKAPGTETLEFPEDF